jgi:hypothetical protein
MLIREAQIKAFQQRAIDNYIVELADHCRDFSPHLCKTLTDEQLKFAIRRGVEKAEAHKITLRGPVRFYVDMTILFGSSFDTDPQYPWAQKILLKTEEMSEMQRSEALYEKTQDYLAKVDGEDNVHTLKALEDLAKLCRQGITFRHETLEPDLLRMMKEIHPRKFEETGEEQLRRLIADGKRKGQNVYNFRQARSLALMVVLMFAFGHGFDADPFLPWISKTLKQPEQDDPDAKAVELERRALIWVDAVLRNRKEEKI